MSSYYNQVYTLLAPALADLVNYDPAQIKRSSESSVAEVLNLMHLAGYKAESITTSTDAIKHPQYGLASVWQLTHLKQKTIYALIWEFK
jgi:hypothetical protein